MPTNRDKLLLCDCGLGFYSVPSAKWPGWLHPRLAPAFRGPAPLTEGSFLLLLFVLVACSSVRAFPDSSGSRCLFLFGF